jgi:hypothetical protein
LLHSGNEEGNIGKEGTMGGIGGNGIITIKNIKITIKFVETNFRLG